MATRQNTNHGENLSIGDVSRICGIPVHTIRYWEREFCDFLQPVRTSGKQRRYADSDIQRILRIRRLLWTQRFSIKAAKRILAAGGAANVSRPGYHTTFDTKRIMMRLAQFAGGNLIYTESPA